MARHYDSEEIPSVYNRSEIPAEEIRPGVEHQLFRGIDHAVGFVTMSPEGNTNPHSHPWEQISYVLDGEGEFVVGDDRFDIEEGDVFVIPPTVEHYNIPSEEPFTIMAVWTAREDYLHRAGYQDEFVTYDHER